MHRIRLYGLFVIFSDSMLLSDQTNWRYCNILGQRLASDGEQPPHPISISQWGLCWAAAPTPQSQYSRLDKQTSGNTESPCLGVIKVLPSRGASLPRSIPDSFSTGPWWQAWEEGEGGERGKALPSIPRPTHPPPPSSPPPPTHPKKKNNHTHIWVSFEARSGTQW